MNLDRVTITGADDSVSPDSLYRLSGEYPFVEWGILISKTAYVLGGKPRYPTIKWITDVQGLAEVTGNLHLSLHICGQWIRDLLIGNITFPTELLHCFQRVQLNFHAERVQCNIDNFTNALIQLSGKDFIFQLDGANGNKYFNSVLQNDRLHHSCRPLFDASGGAGILPNNWPKPIDNGYHGYAGGLGPNNLNEQLLLISEAVADTRIWIDMESHVRSDDDQQFDLEKVKQCLNICKPHIR